MDKTVTLRVICAVLCVVLLGFALYFIPLPTEIDMDLNGYVVTADGEILDTMDIRLRGTKLNYLFQEDTFQLVVTPSKEAWQFAWPSGYKSVKNAHIDIPYMTDGCYFGDTDEISGFGMYALSIEEGCFVAARFGAPDIFLIGTETPCEDASDVLEYFRTFVQFYFSGK